MSMINPNVMHAVGEAFEAHHVTANPNEQMPETVARTLGVSEPEAGEWLEALDQGATVEEANARVGIVSHTGNEPFLNTVARLIGKSLGALSARK